MVLTILGLHGGFPRAVALSHDKSLRSDGVAEAGGKSARESGWGSPLKNQQGDSIPGRGEGAAHRASVQSKSWEPELGFALEPCEKRDGR